MTHLHILNVCLSQESRTIYVEALCVYIVIYVGVVHSGPYMMQLYIALKYMVRDS